MRVFAFLLGLFFATPALAQPADGLYEDFPSIFMEPSGPLTAPTPALARWVDVRTTDGITTVTFEPDARVAWRIAWGPSGPTEKITLVDGEAWTRSAFAYDASGHLANKTVTGAGVEAGLTSAYETDESGRILSRTTTLANGTLERVEVTRAARSTMVTLSRGGVLARSDRYDAQRRLRETRFFDSGGDLAARLTYLRDARGALREIQRRRGRRRGIADPAHVDTTLDAIDVARVALAPIEAHEVRLVLGAAIQTSDTGRGIARTLALEYANGCWLDQVSGLRFDASERLVDQSVGCICGFCVAASAIDPGERARATGIQEHWTRGPWIRLDDAIDVTADHEIVTPDGPRSAGSLHAGDVVTATDGSTRVLRSVEPVEDALRLGVNLETPDRSFSAGGLRFVTEAPRACTPE